MARDVAISNKPVMGPIIIDSKPLRCNTCGNTWFMTDTYKGSLFDPVRTTRIICGLCSREVR